MNDQYIIKMLAQALNQNHDAINALEYVLEITHSKTLARKAANLLKCKIILADKCSQAQEQYADDIRYPDADTTQTRATLDAYMEMLEIANKALAKPLYSRIVQTNHVHMDNTIQIIAQTFQYDKEACLILQDVLKDQQLDYEAHKLEEIINIPHNIQKIYINDNSQLEQIIKNQQFSTARIYLTHKCHTIKTFLKIIA